jgi:dolichol-phosphate mannosyltransferase
MSQELLIALPVINEYNNLIKLIPQLQGYLKTKINGNGSILVIDDNSNDGTKEYITSLKEDYNNIYYIRNDRKVGLGNAYKMAMKFAVENNFEWIQQMDSDFSHRVIDLEKFDKVKNESDLIIGSRYIKGGRIDNWPLLRRLISKGGSLYSNIILGSKIRDLTGGFNRIRVSTLNDINFSKIMSNGYSFQIELKYRVYKNKSRVSEVPIVFSDRIDGTTKMSRKIFIEAVFKVWLMRFMI